MLSLRANVLAASVVIASLVAPAARAQNSAYCYPLESCLTTTTTSVGTTAGIVVLIVMMTKKSDKKGATGDQAAQATELYLRQNALQLAQDLATGQGPVVDELSTALQISTQNRAAFDQLLRSDRKELLALADLRKLDTQQAVLFVNRLAHLMQSHPGLRADLERLSASN